VRDAIEAKRIDWAHPNPRTAAWGVTMAGATDPHLAQAIRGRQEDSSL
jgi:hypothetical protein